MRSIFWTTRHCSLGGHRDPSASLVLLLQLFERRLTDIDHDFDDLSGERKRRFVQIRDWRDGVAADVQLWQAHPK
jgi:hypothetical protein